MKKEPKTSVPMADFKAHLAEYIREVRKGIPLTLLDRRTPVVQVVPYPEAPDKLPGRLPTRLPSEVKLPPPLRKTVDVVRYAAEERQRYR